MIQVRPKKHLGQHFLHDQEVAFKIAGSLSGKFENVLEIGPGTGVLTRYLLGNKALNFKACEIDSESVNFLRATYPHFQEKLIEGDFLKLRPENIFAEPFAVIGNLPYNISSQIFFKILESRNMIPEVVAMVQKEVAERIAAPPGSKTYGILSVLLQAWYDIEYLFTVNKEVFTPPPKVQSGVIRLMRNAKQTLGCDERLFTVVVKTAFNQRRKTLKNALSSLIAGRNLTNLPYLDKRAEQLGVDEFVQLTLGIQDNSIVYHT